MTSPYALQTFRVKDRLLRTIYSLPPIQTTHCLFLRAPPPYEERERPGTPLFRGTSSLTGGGKARGGWIPSWDVHGVVV